MFCYCKFNKYFPFFFQMSSYNPRERSLRGDKTLNAIVRCGQAVHSAVERFVTLGEALADDNVEIKVDMYEACRDARAAGKCTFFKTLQFIVQLQIIET